MGDPFWILSSMVLGLKHCSFKELRFYVSMNIAFEPDY